MNDIESGIAGRLDAGANDLAPLVTGKVQEAIGVAHKAVDQVADKAHAVVADAGDRATELYERAANKVDGIAAGSAPFVRQKPYLTAGLAAAAGIVVGTLLAGRRPKVIYVTPKS